MRDRERLLLLILFLLLFLWVCYQKRVNEDLGPSETATRNECGEFIWEKIPPGQKFRSK